jgi:hypothetical protein
VALTDGGGLDPAGYPELLEDVGDVHAGGLGADEEPVGDLAVGLSGSEQREDLALAPTDSQLGERIGLVGAGRNFGCAEIKPAALGQARTCSTKRTAPSRCAVKNAVAAAAVARERGPRSRSTASASRNRAVGAAWTHPKPSKRWTAAFHPSGSGRPVALACSARTSGPDRRAVGLVRVVMSGPR